MYDWVSFAQFVGYIEHGSGLMFELSVQVSGCILCFLKSVFGFWNYYCRYSLQLLGESHVRYIHSTVVGS